MQGSARVSGQEEPLWCHQSWTRTPKCRGMHTASPGCKVSPPSHLPGERMLSWCFILWRITAVQHLNICCAALTHPHLRFILKQLCVTESTTQHQINPQLTHIQRVRTDSLISDQWAAENYSFILLTSNIFKEIPEKRVFPWLASLQQGTGLLEVFAFPAEHHGQLWAQTAQVSVLDTQSKTHTSNPLLLWN